MPFGVQVQVLSRAPLLSSGLKSLIIGFFKRFLSPERGLFFCY